MKYYILGTVNVSQAIATKLIKLGHEVIMCSIDSKNENEVNWHIKKCQYVKYGTLVDAESFGENVFNYFQGIHFLEEFPSGNVKILKGKILIDLSNP